MVLYGGVLILPESTTSTSRSPMEASIPGGITSLDAILRTQELSHRPRRAPDHRNENSALLALVSALADSPDTILQTLADKVLEVLRADSAGLSLLTKDGKRFYWAAIAGAWRQHIGGGTPRDFGPCGDVLDCNTPMLFTHWERRYPYLSTAIPLAEEGLLVPFYDNGTAVGTIWAIAHRTGRKFDAEDLRLLESMSRFASAAYHGVRTIEDLKFEIAARERAETEIRDMASGLQAKLRRLVDSNVMGIVIWHRDGQIIDANDTFLHMIGYNRNDLKAGRLDWRDLTPSEWHRADERRLEELATRGTAQPYEKEYLHKSGHRVPVLVGAAVFQEGSDDGVAFVVDVSDRKRAEAEARESRKQYREVQRELAHANRVATMGQLSASIGHELNQPIGAAITYANAAKSWLGAYPPDLREAVHALDLVIECGVRAGNVIDRIRALVKKAPSPQDAVGINQAILEVLGLTRAEIVREDVCIETQLEDSLPAVIGDRVQLQQVILNLVLNAIEAMGSMPTGPRKLLIGTAKAGLNNVLVKVQDSGPGFTPENFERLFEAF